MQQDQERQPAREPELVALNGHDSAVEEVVRLRREVARLRDELDAERTSSAAIHAQLAVLSRQLDATQVQAPRGLLRRKR
jgi:hypothetical protein